MDNKLWLVTDRGIEEHEGKTVDDFDLEDPVFTTKNAARDFFMESLATRISEIEESFQKLSMNLRKAKK